jgi:uncharacterized protein with FMN-binding domain
MRRSPIVLAGTVAGTVATLMFRPHAPSITAISPAGDDSSVTTEAGPSSAARASGPSSSGSAGVTPAAVTRVTGAAVTTQYGTTQVRVTLKGGKITDVTTLKSDNGDAESLSITQPALPKLRQSALTKQSAKIDAVSGATYTSGAYQASLQSALDKAGFKA